MAEVTRLSLVKQLPELDDGEMERWSDGENIPPERETIKSPNSVGVTAEELLQTFLSPDWLESSAFKQFIQKVQRYTKPSAKSAPGISILLLDAENLKLDIDTETFLANLCKYRLHVKIAFANWRNPTMGKQDAELYERGYQLVHVPEGKDSADGKMIALGSSILQQYQTVKEVFVCSCDGILTHLCNQLQNQGLTVYLVRRQNRSLKVENRNTGKVCHYSLAVKTEIPSFEGLVEKIEELIKLEQESITERLSKLTAIATLFQERYNLNLSANRSNTSPVILQEQDISQIEKEDEKSNVAITAHSATFINSQDELENVLINILKALRVENPQAIVSVSSLAKELQNVCGKSANSIVTKLNLGSSFIKFLESCSTFKLKKTDKQLNVTISP